MNVGVETGIWRIEEDRLVRLHHSRLDLESNLENYIESTPNLLGENLLIIARQERTIFGGFIDLLAIDETGAVHIIELKRDKTPRDVAAQILDYASWVSTLGRAEILAIYERYSDGVQLEEAFAEHFNDQQLPEEVNAIQVLTIVATELDSATERIVRYLNESFGVPINAVFFNHFVEPQASYLARSWLVEPENGDGKMPASRGRSPKTREPWNGTDWYVTFGDDETGLRSWEDAVRYGFVSAGGGAWYSKTLRNLPINARIFAYIPKRGYVGVGTVMGEAERFDELKVLTGSGEAIKLTDLELEGNYRHDGDDLDDNAEWVVPVQWIVTAPREEAFWHTGMFANQNTAVRLRQQFTIEKLTDHFLGGTEDIDQNR